MKISKLKFSVPVLVMLAVQSGNTMPFEIGQLMYDALHSKEGMKAVDRVLKDAPECVHVKEDLTNVPAEGRTQGELISFMKKEKKACGETYLKGIDLLQQKKKEGATKVPDSEILKYMESKNEKVDKDTFSDEFRKCVQYMNNYYPNDKQDDLPIPVKNDAEERLRANIDDYIRAHSIKGMTSEQAKAALYEVVIYLQKRHEQGQNEVTSENVKGDLKIAITFEELNDFVNYMKGLNEIPAGITVKMTDDERVIKDVKDYRADTTALSKLSDLGEEMLCKIVKYLQKASNERTSDGVNNNCGTVDLTYDDLVKLVTYMNNHDDKLAPLSVGRTEYEQIMYDIGEYRKVPGNAIASNPSDDDLHEVVKYLQGRSVDATVMTSDIKDETGVELTHEELVTLVNYFKGKDNIPNIINVKRTTLENVEKYRESHEIKSNPANEKLCEVVAQLKELGKNATANVLVTTDNVKDKVVFTNLELATFVEYMKQEGELSEKITVEMTDAERIQIEVNVYYTQSESPKKVGNLEEEQAFALAMYMRNQDGKDPATEITSANVKEYIDNLSEKTLTYEDLNAFVNYLNTAETTAGKDPLNVIVKMTNNEKTAQSINNFLTDKGKGNEGERDSLSEILASYLIGLNLTEKIDTDIIAAATAAAATAAGVTAVAFTYPLLEELVESLKGQNGVPGGISVKKTTLENVSDYLENHDIASQSEEDDTLKTKLCDVITTLNNKVVDSQGEEVSVTTDDVKDKVVFTPEELNNFVKYMQEVEEKEISDKIKVVMTTEERIRSEVNEYYDATNPHAVGDLDKDEAYTLAKFMRDQDSESTETIITSDSIKTAVTDS